MPLGTTTRATLIAAVARRLNDPNLSQWATPEVNRYLDDGYRILSEQTRIFWDWVYVENLPRGFSYTAEWEARLEIIAFDYGRTTFTAAFEQDAMRLANLADRDGPGNHTSPHEATREKLSDAGASTAIPATAELPEDLIDIDRGLWDQARIESLVHRDLQTSDTRYQITEGEVFGFLWRHDGVRTFRKVRVPAAMASVYTVVGSWGAMRTITDLSGATQTGATPEATAFTFTATWEQPTVQQVLFIDLGRATYTRDGETTEMGTVLTDQVGPANHTASWESALLARALMTVAFDWFRGVPRQIPSHHAFGYSPWGMPRRPYKDTTNVRLEQVRRGRPAPAPTDIYELPDRYTQALRDYALSQCLTRVGPGQDVRLGAHFALRWARVLARVTRRRDAVSDRRVGRMGPPFQIRRRPPRPSLPWAYGKEVRTS